MNIFYTDTRARENSRATFLIPWAKRENAVMRSKVFMGIYLLIVLLLFYYSSSQGFSLHDFYFGFFLAALLLQFTIYRRYQKQKRLYLADNERQAEVIYKERNSAGTSITDSGYHFETPAFKLYVSWDLFVAYSVFDDFLLLHLDNGERQFVSIEKNCLDDEQWNELYLFVSARMKPFERLKN